MGYQTIYEFLFQTEPLFNNVLLDWAFPALIVFLLYDFAFGIVGGLYEAGIITGRDIGSIIHWGIRYGIMWLVVQGLIFLRDNWIFIIIATILMLGLAMFIAKKINNDSD